MSKVSSVEDNVRTIRQHWKRSHLPSAKVIVQLCDLALAQQEAIRSGQDALRTVRDSSQAARKVVELQSELVQMQAGVLKAVSTLVGFTGDLAEPGALVHAIQHWKTHG